MATFVFKKRGYSMPHVFPNEAPFKKRISMPDLIAYGGLVNTSGVDVALPATGFAANDILQVFSVPAGFWLQSIGVRVVTAEGAACTGTIGCISATQTHLGAAAAGFFASVNFNSATTQPNTVAATQLGPNTGAGTGNMGVVYNTDGTIDLTLSSADTNAFIADIWAMGWRVW